MDDRMRLTTAVLHDFGLKFSHPHAPYLPDVGMRSRLKRVDAQ